MAVEEFHAQRALLDRNDTLIVSLTPCLRIHKAVHDLALALTGIDVFLHALAGGIDGHGPSQVAGAVGHDHVRDVHLELLWVASLEDEGLPKPIPGRCGHLRRGPSHADNRPAGIRSSRGCRTLCRGWSSRLALRQLPSCTQACDLKLGPRRRCIAEGGNLLNDVSLHALLVLLAGPKVREIGDGLELQTLSHVVDDLGVNPALALEELAQGHGGTDSPMAQKMRERLGPTGGQSRSAS
mmetsp:Transcript_31409/g.98485  ORF Transcript_31409/g.98485 Transcript_31409/m.98485 type:complete len:239 (+) Transcript_31409:1581-2297(+)